MPNDNDKTYTLNVTFTVHPHTDEHLQDEQAICDEVQSWLDSLKATVHAISVRAADVRQPADLVGREEPSRMNIAHLTDDELRRELFQRIADRLEAEAKKDPVLLVQKRTPSLLSLSKHGNLLTVCQAEGARLVRGELQWKYTPDQDAPWTFTVARAVDRSQLQITPNGPEGTIDTIVDNIVATFLTQTKQR